MPNEFVARNGVIAQSNSTISGSLTVTNGITGSVTTASYVLNAVSASFATQATNATTASYIVTAQTASFVTTAQTASYVLNAVSASFATSAANATTASYVLNAISASFASQAANATTASYVVTAQTASFITTAQTASYVLTAQTASFVTTAQTASYVLTAKTASYVLQAVSASFSSTASYVNTLNQSVIITNALTVGTSSLGSTENTLVIGPAPAGGVGEGGQILLQASGGIYTSASMFDNWQNFTRLLRGTNTGSDNVVTQWNMHSRQISFPAYTSVSAFAGTAVANLAVDSGGNILTVSTSGGTVFPYTGIASINGGLIVTGSITSSGAIYAQANNQMYFRGGDDAELWDINVANTIGVYGLQDQTIASIKLGSGGGTISGKNGNIGIGTITPSNTLEVVGGITATSFTGSFTGSLVGALIGTASWAQNSITSSFASTSSYVNPLNQNVIISGSLTVTSSVRGTFDSTFSGTNGALRAINASNTAKRVDIGYDNTINGGYINVQEAGVDWRPLFINPLSTIASPVVIGASTDDGINKLQVTGNGRFTGNITASNALINGTITAQTLVIQTVTSSIVYSSGSNRFGSLTSDVQQMTGSIRVSGSGNHWIRGGSVGVNVSQFDPTNPESLLVSGSNINTIVGTADINNYTQLNIVNQNSGNASSADVVATNDTGNESGNFVDLGINSSTFAGAIGAANDGYLYHTGSNFIIGNTTRGAASLRLFSGNDASIFPVIVTGSNAIITGSLLGTASYALNAGSTIAASGDKISSGSVTASVDISGAAFRIVSSSSTFLYVSNSGNIGINATTPTSKLHIAGTTGGIFELDGAGGIDTMYVSSSGNIGMGTQKPTAKLQVSGSSNVVNFRGSGSVAASSIFTVDGAAGRLFSVNDSLSGSLFSVNTIAGLPVMEAFSDNTVRIGQYGQRALFVSQSSIGVGIEIPTSKLHISGNIGGLLEVDAAGTTAFYVSSSGNVGVNVQNATSKLHVSGTTGGLLEVDAAGTTAFYVSSSGNIGIGTDIAANTISIYRSTGQASLIMGDLFGGDAKLQLSSSTILSTVGTVSNSPIALITNNTTRLYISASATGNIGIGTITPSYALDVSGSVRLDHVVGGAPVTTITAGTGAGTGPVLSVTGSDTAGLIRVRPGTTPTANGPIATITYRVPYLSIPYVVFSAANTGSALLSGASSPYVTSSLTSFSIIAGGTALTAGSQYSWSYHVMQ